MGHQSLSTPRPGGLSDAHPRPRPFQGHDSLPARAACLQKPVCGSDRVYPGVELRGCDPCELRPACSRAGSGVLGGSLDRIEDYKTLVFKLQHLTIVLFIKHFL